MSNRAAVMMGLEKIVIEERPEPTPGRQDAVVRIEAVGVCGSDTAYYKVGRIGDYIVQRLCPHRLADLSVFGEIDDDQLVCTLHGWRFDLETGRCVNADDRKLRVRRADN